jgi:hypothetical protein
VTTSAGRSRPKAGPVAAHPAADASGGRARRSARARRADPAAVPAAAVLHGHRTEPAFSRSNPERSRDHADRCRETPRAHQTAGEPHREPGAGRQEAPGHSARPARPGQRAGAAQHARGQVAPGVGRCDHGVPGSGTGSPSRMAATAPAPIVSVQKVLVPPVLVPIVLVPAGLVPAGLVRRGRRVGVPVAAAMASACRRPAPQSVAPATEAAVVPGTAQRVVAAAREGFRCGAGEEGGDGQPGGDLSRRAAAGFQVSGRSCRVWSRRGPIPTAATGAPIMSSSALT